MLKQQVEVTLRLSVNAEESKEDIKKFIEGLINTHAMHSTPHNRMTYNELEVVDIREEAEIYSNKLELNSDYLEIFYEIVAHFYSNPNSNILEKVEREEGRGGMWELAQSLADSFYQDKIWDGEFFDSLENFLKQKL